MYSGLYSKPVSSLAKKLSKLRVATRNGLLQIEREGELTRTISLCPAEWMIAVKKKVNGPIIFQLIATTFHQSGPQV